MTPTLVEGTFLKRPNRFLVHARIGNRVVPAFLPNPGRLQELLGAGTRLRLVPRRRDRRATGFDVLAVRAGEEWICLDTRLPNAAVADALRRGLLPEFAGEGRARAEVPFKDVRFDFLLDGPARHWLEVKMCSLVVRGRAFFPDAPTSRGTHHLQRLAEAVGRGDRGSILFLVVREASRFAPNEATDPAFAEALRSAVRVGVQVVARRASLRGASLAIGRRIPTDL